MSRLHRLGLRRRAALAFGLVGLFASVVVALATFLLALSYLVDQREDSAERQAFANARLVRDGYVPAVIFIATEHSSEWFATVVDLRLLKNVI